MNKKIIIVGLLSMLAVACSSNKAPIAPPVSTSSNNPDTNAVNIEPVVDTSNVNTVDTSNAKTNSIYFAINKYEVDVEDDALINQNANNLAANPATKMRIYGNTDDTGSVEYNLALGQRRADALKRALIAKGGGATQIEAVSNGKLMPKFPNTSDEGRAQNRRADMMYTGQVPSGYHLNDNGLPVLQ